MSFTIADSTVGTDIDISDVSAALDMAVNINLSPTSDQKVAGDVNLDGIIDISDVSAILDMAVNIADSGAGVLRNAALSDQFSTSAAKQIAIQAGNDLTLDAFLLGDLDGSFANTLASS